jgi:serine phosphatase RsbU (regulator of sigma subunit)/anti-sigma regulatory factor (Ser/Thr protein kinase)
METMRHDPREVSELFTRLTDTIGVNLDLAQVLQTVTETGTRLAGASFGAFLHATAADDGRGAQLRVVCDAGGDVSASLPAAGIAELFGSTLVNADAVRIDDIDDIDAGPWRRKLPTAQLPARSYLAMPVVACDGEVIGALLFGHHEAGAFTVEDETYARAVAEHAAAAIRNARLFAAEQRARRRAEQIADTLQLLQRVTARLASATSATEAFEAVVDEVVRPVGAARMGVYLRAGDMFRALSQPKASREQQTHMREVPVEAATPVRDATRSGAPVCLSTRAALQSAYPFVAAAAPDVAATLALPLTVTDATRGALVLAWREAHDFPEEEVRLLTAVAGQLAQALERLRLRDAEQRAQTELHRHVAELTEASQTLQRSLLPQVLPEVDRLSVAVRYRPGTAGAEVGGDWYDVVHSPNGVVTLVVGDVQGHSFSAAAVMGRVSTALRAYLAEGHGPDVALERVNPMVEASGMLTTVCLVSLDTATGLVRLVRAGHPYPVFWRQGTDAAEADIEGGPPLGVGLDGEWPVTMAWARPGDLLLLYTDGLVERPGGDMDAEIARLVAAVDTCPGDVEQVADRVLRKVSAPFTDDVALVVAQYRGAAESGASRLRVETLSGVAQARQFTAAQLETWELAAVADTCLLLVSEMVTNALVHAGGPAALELRRVEDGVRMSVTDGRSDQPEPRSGDVDELGGRGLLLVEALAHSWGVEPAGAGKTVWRW